MVLHLSAMSEHAARHDQRAHDRFALAGSTALVTGDARGIGQAIALALAEAGADVVGVSRSGGSEETAARVRALGRSYRGYACDLGDRAALHAFLERLQSEVPRVDLLVNNAGVIVRKPAAEHPDADWDRVIETNLRSAFVLSRELGRRMLERGSGRIVFIASLLSFQGGILVPSYSASKGGIVQLMMALSNEWAGRGVTVNAVAPGYVETDNTEALRADPVRSQAILDRIPMGRWATAEDIAGPVVFLCSRAAAYVSGHVLVADGGWMAR